ncbi:MAG: hypothetical protein JNK00_07315 [Flavipsychrobacter sp.]|nr:hypothetical protein [Flavipsychrobacter sp.]
MKSDKIIEIGIDNEERLYIKPSTSQFLYIYRSAVEVHWDNTKKILYSPKPRDWTYLKWYNHIIATALDYGYLLKLTEKTEWVNIPKDLKTEILSSNPF